MQNTFKQLMHKARALRMRWQVKRTLARIEQQQCRAEAPGFGALDAVVSRHPWLFAGCVVVLMSGVASISEEHAVEQTREQARREALAARHMAYQQGREDAKQAELLESPEQLTEACVAWWFGPGTNKEIAKRRMCGSRRS